MPRTIIKPEYPDDPEYMKLYKAWGTESDKAYAEFDAWVTSIDKLIADIKVLAQGMAAQVRCNQAAFQRQAQPVIVVNRTWVDSIKVWLEEIRVKLPDEQKVSALKEWDEWYAALAVWMDQQEQWYAGVNAALTMLASNIEAQLMAFTTSLNEWKQKMIKWKEKWPTTTDDAKDDDTGDDEEDNG